MSGPPAFLPPDLDSFPTMSELASYQLVEDIGRLMDLGTQQINPTFREEAITSNQQKARFGTMSTQAILTLVGESFRREKSSRA